MPREKCSGFSTGGRYSAPASQLYQSCWTINWKWKTVVSHDMKNKTDWEEFGFYSKSIVYRWEFESKILCCWRRVLSPRRELSVFSHPTVVQLQLKNRFPEYPQNVHLEPISIWIQISDTNQTYRDAGMEGRLSPPLPAVSDFILVIFEEYNSNNATFFLLVRFVWKFGWSHLTPPACQDFAAQMLILHIFGINFTYYIILNNLLELFYRGMWSGGEDFGSENVEHIDEKLKKVSSCPPFWTSFWPFGKTLTFKKVRTRFRPLELEKTVHVVLSQPDWAWAPNRSWPLFSSSGDRKSVVTFLKVNVFSNGQKLVQKGGQELTFFSFSSMCSAFSLPKSSPPLHSPQ